MNVLEKMLAQKILAREVPLSILKYYFIQYLISYLKFEQIVCKKTLINYKFSKRPNFVGHITGERKLKYYMKNNPFPNDKKLLA